MRPDDRIGAFFDLDGTLMPSPSLEWRFVTSLLSRDQREANALRRAGHWVMTLLLHRGAAVEGNKAYLCGLPESAASEWAESAGVQSLQLFEDGLEHMAWHMVEGHRVVLVSGTLGPLARAIARQLPGNVEVIASELELKDGRWTGRLAGEHMSGPRKARAVAEFAKRHGLQLDQSYAYGDRISDLPMLECVGHPVAVNPGSRFERVARLREWPIGRWRALSAAVVNTGAPRLWLREAE